MVTTEAFTISFSYRDKKSYLCLYPYTIDHEDLCSRDALLLRIKAFAGAMGDLICSNFEWSTLHCYIPRFPQCNSKTCPFEFNVLSIGSVEYKSSWKLD